MNNNDTRPVTHIWPTLVYNDARSAIRFLTDAFGFVESLVVAGESDDTIIEHAQLRWPEGGGVMLGSPPLQAQFGDAARTGSGQPRWCRR